MRNMEGACEYLLDLATRTSPVGLMCEFNEQIGFNPGVRVDTINRQVGMLAIDLGISKAQALLIVVTKIYEDVYA
jgi:hypothetical protein